MSASYRSFLLMVPSIFIGQQFYFIQVIKILRLLFCEFYAKYDLYSFFSSNYFLIFMPSTFILPTNTSILNNDPTIKSFPYVLELWIFMRISFSQVSLRFLFWCWLFFHSMKEDEQHKKVESRKICLKATFFAAFVFATSTYLIIWSYLNYSQKNV